MTQTLTFKWSTVSHEYPFGYIEDEVGARWALTTDRLEWTHEGILWPGATEPTDRCEHCGRADWYEIGPQTFAQAGARGWLVPIAAGNKIRP